MSSNKGFTLIEMLVVIAVIGILSAVVLTALGPARSKARDTRIISGLNQVRTVAEVLYDGDFDALTLTQTQIVPLKDDIGKNGGDLKISLSATAPAQSYRAHSKLNGSGRFYCVDSAGFAGEMTPSEPNVTAVCDVSGS